ncbi:MAG: hypothetical protein II969_04540 [Anaerolineaceae bacterium]|nr:hypothetical protein [Anaerolineaceae bacterium]
MNLQTFLNIILGILTVWLAYRNFVSVSKKDTQRESEEMTEIRVQLTQVMAMLRDLQKDVRTSTADFRALSERVVILETKLDAAFQRIDELKAHFEN